MVSATVFVTLSMVVMATAYSGGAPEDVCADMTPKHPTDPQQSAFPYKVTVDADSVKAGDKVKITISGGKPFKGYLLQVRDGEEAVGTFTVSDTDKYTKTINCFSKKQNAVTHKNSAEKESLTLEWVAPAVAKTYTVYATVAENGGVFWVHQPTAKITVH